MRSKICFTLASLLFISTIIFAQNEKIKGKYYSANLILSDGSNFDGIILATNEVSFSVIERRYWKIIKGKQKSLVDVEKALYERGVLSSGTRVFQYKDLGIVEVKKRNSTAIIRKIGFYSGLTFGALVGIALGTSFGESSGSIAGFAIIGAGTFGLAGLGAGSLLSIRVPKKILVKEIEDKKWQKSLLQYSILR